MGSEQLVVVYEAESDIDALLFRELLEEAGIAAIEQPLETGALEGVRLRGLHSRLLVQPEDAEQARALVDAFREEADTGELSKEIPAEETDTAEEYERKNDE